MSRLSRQSSTKIQTSSTSAATLERLEAKGYVSWSMGAPTAERGGRAKRLFQIEGDGRAALETSQEAIRKMTRGLRNQWGTT
jgi:DNA-binding PadR family transcriptional regulator